MKIGFKKQQPEDYPELNPIRRVLLSRLQFFSLIIGIPPLITGILASIHGKSWLIGILDIGVYLIIIILYRIRKNHYFFSALGFVLALFILAAVLVLELGMEASTVMWFFVPLFLANLFLSNRTTRSMFITTALILVFIGFIMHSGHLHWKTPLVVWLVVIFNFLAIAVYFLYTSRFIVDRLSKSLRKERRLNQRLRISAKENENLVREIHHRVKNNLQLMLSIFRLEHGSPGGNGDQNLMILMENRFSALAMSYSYLERTGESLSVRFGEMLSAMIHQTYRNLSIPFHSFNDSFEPITLSLEDAVPLSLLISEILSECFLRVESQGGSKTNLAPKISLTTEEGSLVLSIRGERPSGNPETLLFPELADSSTSDSLGNRIIRSLTEQIEANVSFHNSGDLLAMVRFPLQP